MYEENLDKLFKERMADCHFWQQGKNKHLETPLFSSFPSKVMYLLKMLHTPYSQGPAHVHCRGPQQRKRK